MDDVCDDGDTENNGNLNENETNELNDSNDSIDNLIPVKSRWESVEISEEKLSKFLLFL
jgi:hypothetical protein